MKLLDPSTLGTRDWVERMSSEKNVTSPRTGTEGQPLEQADGVSQDGQVREHQARAEGLMGFGSHSNLQLSDFRSC